MGHFPRRAVFWFRNPERAGQIFHVWLDAGGYMGSFKNLCDKRGDTTSFLMSTGKDSDAELYRIGKGASSISTTCSGLPCWKAATFRKPTNLFVHVAAVNGAKMIQRSRGTDKASFWLAADADSLRYYYTAKLSSRIDDIDLNTETFVQRVNADIVNKVVADLA